MTRGKNIKGHFMSHLTPNESKQPQRESRAVMKVSTILLDSVRKKRDYYCSTEEHGPITVVLRNTGLLL